MTVPTLERSLERSPCPLVYLCRSLSPLSVPVGWSLVLTGVPDDLLAVLGAVEDRRAPRGVRHNLVTVLAIEVCAVLAGVRPFTAIAEWANDLPVGCVPGSACFGIRPAGIVRLFGGRGWPGVLVSRRVSDLSFLGAGGTMAHAESGAHCGGLGL